MRKTLTLILSILILVGVAGARPAAAEDCYGGWDGDGYAANGATAVDQDLGGGINCDPGYSRFTGDCAPNDRNIHPRREEVGFNGWDDDCDGKFDEADPWYNASGNANTSTSFDISYRLTHRSLTDAGTRLRGYFIVSALNGSQTRSITLAPQSLFQYGGQPYARFRITDLLPTRVYKVGVWFLNDAGFTGVVGDEYYTTTDGTTTKSFVRTAMVLRALSQFRSSQEGRIGWRGTEYADGTRYGASLNEKWCSEFFAWNASGNLEGDVASKTNVDGLVSYFDGYTGGSYRATADILRQADRGDYVAMDWNGDTWQSDDMGDHSGMVLAVSGSEIWTVEGNAGEDTGPLAGGNQVTIHRRTVNTPPPDGNGGIVFLGHITDAMI